MKPNKLTLLVGTLALIGLLICIVMMIIAVFGGMRLTSGCLMRYNVDSNGAMAQSDIITSTITLKASANYKTITIQSGGQNQSVVADPNAYGHWLNTQIDLDPAQKVDLQITGDITLCKAYLPINNIGSNSNLNSAGKKIPIPAVEDNLTPPLSIAFSATTDEWRNLLELFYNDKVVVSISPDKKPIFDGGGNMISDVAAVPWTDPFTGQVSTIDCREGGKTYHPACGRYSIYSGFYIGGCLWDDKCYQTCVKKCLTAWGSESEYWGSHCAGLNEKIVCTDHGCWRNVASIAPEPYKYDGRFTTPWSNDINNLFINTNLQCSNADYSVKDKDFIVGDFQNQRYFWFSADSATGLLWRFDNNINPTSANTRGAVYNFAEIQQSQDPYNDPNYKILMNTTYQNSSRGYLQYRFHDNDGQFTNNTGGYVLNVKQTKCRRSNGQSFNDSIVGRGRIDYILAPGDEDPNTSGQNYNIGSLNVDNNGKAIINSANKSGTLWMRINNAPADYQESEGQYLVQFSTSKALENFGSLILTPLFEGLKTKISTAVSSMFKNMTCYGNKASGNCTNFFNYIRGMLSLYIMIYGLMFLLGMVQINQTDIVIRVIKIAFVAGLMNEKTFGFFNTYVFEAATGFSDSIISSMSGYSLFSSGGVSNGSVSNPFMFLDSILSKVFFSVTFYAQLLALLSMGISGILYFIIVFIAIVIVVITTLRAIAIYLMAFIAVAILLGIAPLFLTFMLFETTRYLFDNWVRFTARYMIEPVILLAGIIILTQLFTIYLDYVIGYSVCWKCAIPFKLPFAYIPGLNSLGFANVPLFCINWFAPWGFDYQSGMMGMNMQHIIALVIIAYCMYGYAEMASSIVFKLMSAGPSAINMGNSMASSFENKALQKIGMDAGSRQQIQHEAQERLKQRQNTVSKSKEAEKLAARKGGVSNSGNGDNSGGRGQR